MERMSPRLWHVSCGVCPAEEDRQGSVPRHSVTGRRNTLHAARLFTSLRCLPCAFPVQLCHPPGLNITVVPDPPNSDRYAAYLVLKLVEGN